MFKVVIQTEARRKVSCYVRAADARHAKDKVINWRTGCYIVSVEPCGQAQGIALAVAA